MSNIIRREEEKSVAQQRDPLRWMRELLHWDPAREAAPLWTGPSWEPVYTPAFEVKETKECFEFKADLPGIKESDVEVKITGNRLAISGKREVEQQSQHDTYYAYERSYGSFQRSFALPDGLDTEHVHAELKNGVLAVVVPKKAGAQTKTIVVKTAETPKS